MTPNEPPFRPSTELENKWLVDADRHAMISFTPPPAEMTDWAKAMHALIVAQLAEANPFGVFMPPSFTSLPNLKDLNLDDK